MVYNTASMVKLPHHNASILKAMNAGIKKSMMKGSGNGSVLLRQGGGGAGSSYMDIDDYIATTGINPYTRANTKSGTGMGSTFTNKLSKLNIAPPTQKLRKNIVMSF